MRDSQKLIEKNAEQIGRYLAYREMFDKQVAGSFFNDESDRVSENPTTISEKGWRLMDDPYNQDTHKYLSIILPEMRRMHWVDYRPFQWVENDPGILKRWQEEDDQENLRAFEYACRLAAKMLLSFFGPVRIKVNLKPRDEMLPHKQVTGMRADAEREKRWGTEHSYRVIAREVKDAMQENECGIDAAKGLIADRRACSFSRVHQAWLFAQNEEESA